MNNDLRAIAQQFVSTNYHCRVLEIALEERVRVFLQERATILAANEAELSNYRLKVQGVLERNRQLELCVRDIQESFAEAEKRRKLELDKKAEKINNQKRRIKEQQDQIDVSYRFNNAFKCEWD